MTRMDSFTRVENELLPKFRNMINQSESTEDVKKFFVYCMQDLFAQVFEERLVVRFEEIALSPDKTPPFTLAASLQEHDEFVRLWQASDLSQIVTRFAELALGRYRHLEKNPRKTEAKIRM